MLEEEASPVRTILYTEIEVECSGRILIRGGVSTTGHSIIAGEMESIAVYESREAWLHRCQPRAIDFLSGRVTSLRRDIPRDHKESLCKDRRCERAVH